MSDQEQNQHSRTARQAMITPYLVVNDARAALAWYGDALGAERQGEPYVMDDDRVGHAELRVGGAELMLADEYPELDLLSPRARGGTTVSLHLEVSDVDSLVARAGERGATLERPPEDQPHGRTAAFHDPFGHRWLIFHTKPPDSTA